MDRLYVRTVFMNVVLLLTSLLLCSCSQEEGDDAPLPNRAPSIDSIQVSPNQVEIDAETVITAFVHDPDEDELLFEWSTYPEGIGYFPDESRNASIRWHAPHSTGPVYIVVSAVDGQHTTRDSIRIEVKSAPVVQIVSPGWNNLFGIGDTVRFRGSANDVDGPSDLLHVEWYSDISGLLHTGAPNSNGVVEFSTSALPYAEHAVALIAIDGDGLRDTAFVTVNVLQPPSPHMYEPFSAGSSVTLAWSPVGVPDFDRYTILRSNDWGSFTRIFDTRSVNDTVYEDHSVAIGRQVFYTVEVSTAHDHSATGDTVGTVVGTVIEFNRKVGDFCFGSDPGVVYIALFSADSVVAVDLSTGHVQGRTAVGSHPNAMAYVPSLQQLYVVNTGGRTLSVLSVPALEAVAQWNLPVGGWDIAYCAAADRLVVTSGGTAWESATVLNPVNGQVVAQFEPPQSSGFYGSALVVADSATPTVYVGETSISPAGLYKFNIANDNPSFLNDDEHGSIGSNLQDLALMPNGAHILLACGSPYYVQVLSTQTFQLDGQLATSAYPNAVFASANGIKVAAAHASSEVLVYAMPSMALLNQFALVSEVSDRGVALSPDGRFALVAMGGYPYDSQDVAIIRLD